LAAPAVQGKRRTNRKNLQENRFQLAEHCLRPLWEEDMRIGWIGLGKLGLPMAQKVREAGFELQVFDLVASRQEIPGARFARSMEELASSSEIVITSLPNDEALTSVALTAFACMGEGTLLIDTSTVSPQACDSVRVSAGHVSYLAAPVSGSTNLAALGQLTTFCSGPEAAFSQAKPVFESFSGKVFNVGKKSEARYLKLALNHFIGTTAQIAAEALTLARVGGVEWPVLLDVLEQSAAASPLIKQKVAAMRHRDFSPAFTIDQMLKDMTLILEAGASQGIEMRLAKVVVDAFRRQSGEGLANLDMFSALLSVERAVGLGEP
jgi:3-hydroxyisobutyrate dehydrogenase-like beta-hydroxyacid dehydrogenase